MDNHITHQSNTNRLPGSPQGATAAHKRLAVPRSLPAVPRKSQPLSPGPRVSSLTLDGRGVVAGPSLLPVGAPHHDVLGRAVKGGLLSRAAAGVEGRRGRLRRSAVGGRGRGRRVAAICALVSFAACCGRRKCCWEYDSTIRSQEMLFETSVQSNPDQAGPKPSHSRPAAKPPLEAPGLRAWPAPYLCPAKARGCRTTRCS